MKKIFLLLPILLISTIIRGQELSFSIAPTWSNVYHFLPVTGGFSGNAKAGFSASFEYLKNDANKFSWGVGLSYEFSRIEIVPAPMPPEEPVLHTETVNLLSPGFKARFNFRKGFFLCTDPFIGIDLNSASQRSIDNQTGLGFSFGFGKKIPLGEDRFLHIEPYVRVHNVMPFVDYRLPIRLTVLGLKAGITFLRE